MHPDSVTPVYAPLRLDDPDAHPWQAACDAVVVGFGAAGACAALEGMVDMAANLSQDSFGATSRTPSSGWFTLIQQVAGSNPLTKK